MFFMSKFWKSYRLVSSTERKFRCCGLVNLNIAVQQNIADYHGKICSLCVSSRSKYQIYNKGSINRSKKAAFKIAMHTPKIGNRHETAQRHYSFGKLNLNKKANV